MKIIITLSLIVLVILFSCNISSEDANDSDKRINSQKLLSSSMVQIQGDTLVAKGKWVLKIYQDSLCGMKYYLLYDIVNDEKMTVNLAEEYFEVVDDLRQFADY